MSDYNKYVIAINKIFENLAKMKNGWNNSDNLNYIESIEEYKNIISTCSEILKTNNLKKSPNLEELGND
ncbi:MAG: hypothetical protein HFJ11_02515 [Bacilli bacterium]|nr:hypothetical protein [Bacilli bacterium]